MTIKLKESAFGPAGRRVWDFLVDDEPQGYVSLTFGDLVARDPLHKIIWHTILLDRNRSMVIGNEPPVRELERRLRWAAWHLNNAYLARKMEPAPDIEVELEHLDRPSGAGSSSGSGSPSSGSAGSSSASGSPSEEEDHS